MSNEEQRREWLHEHLSYELLMSRHTHQQLQPKIKNGRDQLIWNANFVAFAAYARNLCDFLTNNAGSQNFEAEHYVKGFKANKAAISGIMNNLNQQALHPGKQRTPPDDETRVTLGKVNKVFDWINENMTDFVHQLKEPYSSAWDWDMAAPKKCDQVAVPVFQSLNHTTSSHPGMWSTRINFR